MVTLEWVVGPHVDIPHEALEPIISPGGPPTFTKWLIESLTGHKYRTPPCTSGTPTLDPSRGRYLPSDPQRGRFPCCYDVV